MHMRPDMAIVVQVARLVVTWFEVGHQRGDPVGAQLEVDRGPLETGHKRRQRAILTIDE